MGLLVAVDLAVVGNYLIKLQNYCILIDMILFGIIFGIFVTLVVAICYILVISFTVWMAIDAGKQDRFWWLTLIIGMPVIGPAAYYFTEKKHQYAKVQSRHIHESETEEQHEKAPKKKVVRKLKEKVESKTEVKEEKQVEPEVIQVV